MRLLGFLVVALVLVSPSVAAAQPVVEYDHPEERAAAWALLRRPLAFEPGTADLTALSREVLEDQALTLAQNPELVVAVGLEVDPSAAPDEARALFEARVEVLEAALAEGGVASGQVRIVPVPADEASGAGSAGAEETADIFVAEGALTAGVAQAPYSVRSWSGAEVFLIPKPIYDRDDRIVCAPPSVARVGFAGADGTLDRRHSQRAVVLVARLRPDTAIAFHDVGDPTPVNLTTPVGVCD